MMIKLEMEPAAGQTERIVMSDYDTMGFVLLGMSDRPGAASVTMLPDRHSLPDRIATSTGL
jgi:hypothetical protein